MDSTLGNYLSSSDLIVVHLCGKSKDLTMRKTQDYLGLTITDNGQGRAFVKKVKSDDENVDKLIKPGDHIAAINSESTLGMRHYEVAKAIRDIPLHSNFIIRLVEPQHQDCYLAEEAREREHTNNNDSQKPLVEHGKSDINSNDSDLSYVDDLINSSLPIDQLLAKRSAPQGEADKGDQQIKNKPQQGDNHHDNYKLTIDKINSILESFLGINDNLLAIKIYRLAHENRHSYGQFSGAIQTSELNVFNFDDDIQNYLWNCATGLEV